MAQRKQTSGRCAYCGREFAGSQMTRHLASCPQRKAAIEKADAGQGKAEPHYHLVAQGAYAVEYWLHLEMRGTAMLDDLDAYLRAIWLECCGHMSMFTIGGQDFTSGYWMDSNFGDQAMTVRAQQVLSKGLKFEHQYDFGSTTYLKLRVVGERMGRPTTDRPLALMARNDKPAYACQLCDQPATKICTYCMYERDKPFLYCEVHASAHEEHEEAFLPLVNSPRAGECAYGGPAEPPY